MNDRRFEPAVSTLESRITLSGPGTIITAEWWPYPTPPPPPPLKILAPPPPTTPPTTVIV